MAAARDLAQLVGPVLLALSVTEPLNLDIWTGDVAAVAYLSGVLLFTAGLAIVRVHNRWTLEWPVLLTLVGWTGLAGGLIRMAAPEAARVVEGGSAYALFAAIFAVGLFLTVKGYTGRDHR